MQKNVIEIAAFRWVILRFEKKKCITCIKEKKYVWQFSKHSIKDNSKKYKNLFYFLI